MNSCFYASTSAALSSTVTDVRWVAHSRSCVRRPHSGLLM